MADVDIKKQVRTRIKSRRGRAPGRWSYGQGNLTILLSDHPSGLLYGRSV